MRALDFLVQTRLSPSASLAQDAHFLQEVTAPSAPRRPLLRVYELAGEGVALGRYHLAPVAAKPGVGPWLYRRHSGGRAAPFGEGFVGVTLVLPHRSALLSNDPFALAPHQVLNRYVRGILHACRRLGLEAFYPGRDAVTSGGRVLGLMSFEVDRSGAMLFETILAVGRDFSILPSLLETVDRSGVVKAEVPEAQRMTCIERQLGRRVDLAELAEALRQGYEQHFKLSLDAHTLTPAEQTAIDAIAADRFAADLGLHERRLPTGSWRYAGIRGQLGMFEAYVDLGPGCLRAVRFAGDFIANSVAVDQLECDLRSCAPDWDAIDTVVSRVYSRPENYVLGIGKLHTIADTIMKALGT